MNRVVKIRFYILGKCAFKGLYVFIPLVIKEVRIRVLGIKELCIFIRDLIYIPLMKAKVKAILIIFLH